MDYQRPIKYSYLFESAGYALLAYGIGSTVHGFSQRDTSQVADGLTSIVSGFSTIAMSRTIRSSAVETRDYLRSLENAVSPDSLSSQSS